MTMTDDERKVRFWSRVVVPSMGEPRLACWKWQGHHSADGYGKCHYKGKTIHVHRLAYELAIGPIPDGLVIDHLCRHRWCANPYHMEPVTSRENTLRGQNNAARNAAKTQCHRGHAFSPENTYVDAKGQRGCRICRKQAVYAWLQRNAHKNAATSREEMTA